MNAIETRGLSKYFGNHAAVQNLNLTLPQGQIYGFLGENGAGKSTTIRMLLGLIWPDAGEALLNGKRVHTGSAEAMQDLGAMLDNPHLYSHLTVEQNLRLFAGLSGPVSDEQIDRALRLLGLEDKKRHVSGTLSHGQKQRVGIAQALLPDNHLLLLDEPQNGLDPLWVKNLRELLKNLSAEGISILISSHRLHEIEQVCDRVGIIHKGEMLYEGPVGPLLVSDDFVSLRCAPRETPLEGPTPLRPHSIASGNQPVLTFLAQQGIESKPGRNGSILVKAADDNAIAKVNRLLVENRFDVSEIVQTRMTLEEMFLQLTHDKESMTISPLAEGEGQE